MILYMYWVKLIIILLTFFGTFIVFIFDIFIKKEKINILISLI